MKRLSKGLVLQGESKGKPEKDDADSTYKKEV